MPNLTAVHVTNGIPDAGTGTVSTIDELILVGMPLNAGSAVIGNVGGKTVQVTASPAVTISTAYGPNFIIGGLLTFTSALTTTGSGILQGVCVNMPFVETIGFTFIPFNANPSNSTWTDDTVSAIAVADVGKIREPVALVPYTGLGTATVAYATGLGIPLAPGTSTVYGILLANATLTNQFGTTTGLTVTIKMFQDA